MRVPTRLLQPRCVQHHWVSYHSDLSGADAEDHSAEHVGFLAFVGLGRCSGHHLGNCSSGVSSTDLTRPCAGYTCLAPFSRSSLHVARTTGFSKAWTFNGRSPVKTAPSSSRSETQ